MSTILITGAAGFIGSHLSETCIEQGYDVRAFVHYNSRNQWGWLETSPYRDHFQVIAGDIRDYDSVHKALKGCDAVFHLAALIGIPYSYVSPLAYIRTNIEGTYNVLEASRDLGVNDILVTSTSETYGTAQYVPIDEGHPLVGQSPYSATKIAADQLALSYWRSFDLPVKVVRPFNTFGPRQSARAIIPTIVTQILSGERTLKLGNLAPTRDLTFVRDTAMGFICIHRSERLYGEVTNIGMNTEISMAELARTIAGLMGVDVDIVSEAERVRPGASEVERLVCGNAKILAATDWRPRYTFRQGLGETIDWLRGHLDLYKPGSYTI
jgi:dTDP-glucose 4,6-dehydratase